MKEIKILYVHDFCFYKSHINKNNCYTAVGMPEDYFDRFFEAGFTDVEIISRNKIENDNVISESGFSYIHNKKISIPILLANYISLINPKTIISLYKLISKTDLLVINFPSIIGIYIWFLNLILRKPYTLEVAADTDQFQKKKLGFLVTYMLRYLFPKVVNRSKGGIYVSKYLLEKYPHPQGVVASNVVINNVCALPENNITNCLGNNILFVGGVNKRKGIATLIHAMKEIVEHGFKDTCLYIVGGHHDDDYLSMVKSYGLANNVKFMGILKPFEVKQQMKKASLYIQPSYSEGIPRATLEAMSFNLPVIATTLPGFAEILDSRCLFPAGDYKKLSNLIERFIQAEPSLMETLVLNHQMVKTYMFSNLQKLRVDFYKKIIRGINERL